MKYFLLLSVLLSSTAFARSQKEDEQTLRDLVKASQVQKPACDRFTKEAEVSSPKSKSDFVKLASTVQSFPGRNDSTVAAREQVRSMVELYDSPDISAASDIYMCDWLGYMSAVKKLIYSGKLLSAAEKAKFSQDILKQMQRHSAGSTSLLELLIMQSLVNEMVQEKMLKVSDAIFVGLTELFRRTDEFRLDLHRRALSKEINYKDKSQRNYEVVGTEPLRVAFTADLNRLVN